MTGGQEPIEIVRADRRRLVPVFLAALLFVVASLRIVAGSRPTAAPIGIFGLVFFGACLVTSIILFIRPPIIVLFGRQGIALPTGFLRKRAPFIPWTAIRGLRVYRFEAAPVSFGFRMLGLIPADPNDAIWTESRLRRLNRRLTGVPVSVSGQLVPGELEELAERFRRYKEELPVEYGKPRAAGMAWLTRPPRPKRKR